MLKWIRRRTIRLSAPSCVEPSCLSANMGDNSILKDTGHLGITTNAIQSCEKKAIVNNRVCPPCRNARTTDQRTDNSCACREDGVKNSDKIDYDEIKRQTHKLNFVKINNNLNTKTNSISIFISRNSPLCRSRSDVTDLKYTRLPKRLSPRSRHPIINPAEFAELSSDDESSGYGDSENQSGYSSDDSLRTMLHSMLIQPKNQLLNPSPPLSSPCASPVPKMGCRAMVQRSTSVQGRTYIIRNIAIRTQSLNRSVRPSCGVRRSRSKVISLRKVKHVARKGDNVYQDNDIKQTADIRTELQNLYSLDKSVKYHL